MTETEVNEVIERILDLYIKEVKQYYDQPRYTERPNAHTLLEHLWRVLDETKKNFINWKDTPEINLPPEPDFSDLLKGS
jgi:hypothetical protein